MGWASIYIEALTRGETVRFRPRGNSMSGRVEHRQLCTVEPVEVYQLEVGDVVLCRVRGIEYLHLVGAIQDDRVRIENNRGHVNGWTSSVYGKLVKVDP